MHRGAFDAGAEVISHPSLRGTKMSDDYQRRSYGDTPVGFGAKPGIVVVDFMVAFTDPQYPLGGAPLVLRAFENTVKLLEVARRYNVPVASCNTAYMNEREMPYWKISAVRDTFLHDHPSAPIDPRVHDPAYDLTVCKKGPSIFFNTGVAEYFNKERVDTVIVTGCNTSGCIRASAVDSFSYRYRTIVPEDCVGDIEEQPHRDNLRDIGRRYVDVSDLATVLAQLEDWRKSNAA
jgi:maleamate amidohydrolase